MTNPDPRFQRDYTPEALEVLNWYRHDAGRQPLNTDNTQAVEDDVWERMSAADRAALWSKYPPVAKLTAIGLVTSHEGRFGGHWIEPTDAGRAWVEAELKRD